MFCLQLGDLVVGFRVGGREVGIPAWRRGPKGATRQIMEWTGLKRGEATHLVRWPGGRVLGAREG